MHATHVMGMAMMAYKPCSFKHELYSMLLVASFPGLPRFYFPFAFTIIPGSGSLAKNKEGLGAFITLVDARWT